MPGYRRETKFFEERRSTMKKKIILGIVISGLLALTFPFLFGQQKERVELSAQEEEGTKV